MGGLVEEVANLSPVLRNFIAARNVVPIAFEVKGGTVCAVAQRLVEDIQEDSVRVVPINDFGELVQYILAVRGA